MKLPDFLEFEPFNALRREMGAENLGQFDFFDPRQHLNAEELQSLSSGGLSVGLEGVRSLENSTLAFKNSRVLLYLSSPKNGEQAYYHLAECTAVLRWRDSAAHSAAQNDAIETNACGIIVADTTVVTEPPFKNLSRWRVAVVDPSQPEQSYHVCADCLQKVHYRSFDAARSRHREYSQRIRQHFSLQDFFQHYPCYPLRNEEVVTAF